MSGPLRRATSLSSWRKLALANWRDPVDPTVYGLLEVDAGPALAWVEAARARTGVKVTLTHLVGRAVALAIAEQPDVNARISRRGILLRDTVDLFFQVATEGGRDLSGAKVDQVESLSAVAVAQRLAARAAAIRSRQDPQFERTRRLMQALPAPLVRVALGLTDLLVNELDLHLPGLGLPRDPFGSAMITNVGSFGLTTAFAPLVPMSRTPIVLALGAVEPRPAVVDGQVVARPTLVLSATFDHRLMDGYQAGRLAQAVRTYLADPGAFEPPLSG